jgi:undecaprenyl diphosphate synthase
MLIPQHVGFIMDGNGRWAQQQGLPRPEGHRMGIQNILKVLDICYDFGINIVSTFVWSTENWERPTGEARALMYSIQIFGPHLASQLHDRGVRILHSGSRQNLSATVLKTIDNAVELTEANGPRVLNLAFNYGGRAELVRAVKQVVEKQIEPQAITETTIADCLYTAGLPDVDLVIRSGGDKRISNFLLWQIAYAWIYITDTYWPAISRSDIESAIESYNTGLVKRQNNS